MVFAINSPLDRLHPACQDGAMIEFGLICYGRVSIISPLGQAQWWNAFLEGGSGRQWLSPPGRAQWPRAIRAEERWIDD